MHGHRLLVATALSAFLISAAIGGPRPALSGEDELLQGAAQRIEEHRKSDVTIVVVDAAGQPLKDVDVTVEQTRHAFLFGCNIFQFGRFPNPHDEESYRSEFAALWNYATLPFYWPSYEFEPGHPQYDRTEQVAHWCRDQNITTKGHPLAWNYFEPRWLPDDLQEVRRLQMQRITDCVTRFHDLVDIWDVVNEATHFEREDLSKRAPKLTRLWTEMGRVPFVNECFRQARAANPQATLLLNDYRVDAAYVQLIQDVTQEAAQRPFDVIGIQSHMHGGVWSNEKIWEVCERFAPLGAPLHFTELTVLSDEPGGEARKDGTSWLSTPAGEARQAQDVVRIYTMLFSHPAVQAITWWDFSDRNAWQNAPAGILGKDLKPKAAYTALKDLIRNQWWTRAHLTTDADGRGTIRGFHGDYKVTVRLPSGKQMEMLLTIKPGASNTWDVKFE